MYNGLRLLGESNTSDNKPEGKKDARFEDVAADAYYFAPVQWAVANGIVNGSNGKLNPKNNATRAEVAAILMRFCEKTEK